MRACSEVTLVAYLVRHKRLAERETGALTIARKNLSDRYRHIEPPSRHAIGCVEVFRRVKRQIEDLLAPWCALLSTRLWFSPCFRKLSG